MLENDGRPTSDYSPKGPYLSEQDAMDDHRVDSLDTFVTSDAEIGDDHSDWGEHFIVVKEVSPVLRATPIVECRMELKPVNP